MLHIYGQEMWHDDAYIVGTRVSLEKLHRALTKTLESCEEDACQLETADGEDYHVIIMCRDGVDLQKSLLPYKVESFSETKGTHPYRYLKPGRYKELITKYIG